MCRKVTCQKCGKPTWAGCGRHIETALAGIPEADRCHCPRDDSQGGCLLNEEMPIYVTQLKKEPEIPFLPDDFVNEPKLPEPASNSKRIHPRRIVSHNVKVYKESDMKNQYNQNENQNGNENEGQNENGNDNDYEPRIKLHPIDLSIEQIEQTLNLLRSKQYEFEDKVPPKYLRKRIYHQHLDYDSEAEVTPTQEEVLEKTRREFLNVLREQQMQMEKNMRRQRRLKKKEKKMKENEY